MQLNWLGNDLSVYIDSAPSSVVEVGKQTIIDDFSEIKLLNENEAFTENNSMSILNGITWRGEPVKLYDDNGKLIIDGYCTDGTIDGAFFVMRIQSALKKYFDSISDYYSLDTTPAMAALGVLQSVGYPTDKINYNSFYAAHNKYSNNNVSCGFYLQKKYGINLITALNAICEMGIARIYIDGQIYFDVHDPEEDSLYVVEEKDMLSNPGMSIGSYDEIKNDYSLGYLYDASVPATDANGSKYGSIAQGDNNGIHTWSVNYDETSNYQINNKITADYLGGLKMIRDRYVQKTYSVKMRTDIVPLEMNRVRKLTFGNISEKKFRLIKRTRNYSVATCVFEEFPE